MNEQIERAEQSERIPSVLASERAADGLTVYFSTDAHSAKVRQLRSNPRVALLFQREDQELATFVNVTVYGTAREVSDPEDNKRAIAAIGARNPGFQARTESGGLSGKVIFAVEPHTVKLLDFGRGRGAEAVEILAMERAV